MSEKFLAAFAALVSSLSFAATVSVDVPTAESDLRAALASANAGDTIELTSSAANPVISLTGVTAFGGDASLAIDKSLTIVGPAGGVTIDGGWNGKISDNSGTRLVKIIGSDTAVTFRNVTFVNGNGTYYNNDVRYLQGGAIYTEGPLTLENCAFRNNVAANITGAGVYDTSVINGGGAVYAKNGLSVRACVFETNSVARIGQYNSVNGGAVVLLGGALSVSDSTFSGNACGSYRSGGAFYLGANVASASFSGSTFTGEHTGIYGDLAEGGGAIMSEMTSGSIVIDGCAFTNCYTHSSCKGGAIRCDGSVAPIVRNSSFVGCYGGNGGAVYVKTAGALFVNCLFQDNAVNERGAAVRTEYNCGATLVNCSLAGNICLKTEDGWDSPGAYHAPSLRLLNTVVAYNFLNVAGGPSVRDGEGGFSGAVASLWAYNTDYADSTKMFANTKAVTTAVGAPTAANNVTSIGATTLQGAISVPEADAIDPNGVLAAGGYPVKMTADGSYVGYSTDGGANWTTFVGDAANAASATPITKDIRGVDYETGKTPIGAVCGAGSSGEGPVEPAEPTYPSIGSVNATVLGSSATVTLSDIVKGTDANAAAAFGYSAYLTYSLADGGAQHAELAGQSASSCAFTLASLEAGNYTYTAVVTNSAGLGSAAVNGSFTIKAAGVSIAAQAAKLLESQGWLAAPMTGYPSDFVTDGYVITNYWNNKTISEVFAYSCNNDIAANDPTVAGVPFHRPGSRALEISPWWGSGNTAYYYGLYGSNGDSSNVTRGYDRLLTGGWNASDTTNRYTFTIQDLEPYETYLVQLVIHSNRGKDRAQDSGLYEKFAPAGDNQYLRTAVIGGQSIQYGDVEEGGEWWYGGTFVKVFSADRSGRYSFEVHYPNKSGLYNAIQVRKVDRSTPSAEPVEAVAPQLASATVTPTNSFALVTFGGVNRGSGTDGLMAKNVSIYFACATQGSELPKPTAVASVATSESTVTALLSGLAAGTYDYTAYAKNACGESAPIHGSFTIAANADPATDAPLLVISEIAASNPEYSDGGIKTANGRQELDWVEIYNSSDFDIDITGWYLHDDPSQKQSKWKTVQGNGVVPAKGYKIVWCDKDYANFAINEAYSRIGLSTSGENLFLASPDGVIVSRVDFPSQVKGVTYGLGRLAGSGELQYVYFSSATPGAANGEYGAGPMTPKVLFSVPHGYKTEAFDVTLACEDDPTAAIYYTTDGSSPTTASTPYAGAIRVDRTTCLRAAVPRANSVMQQDATATYIFLDDVLSAEPGVVPAGFPTPTGVKQEFNGQHFRYGMSPSVVNGPDRDRILRGFTNSVATISLVVDPGNLFSTATGIYVNASAKYDWQRGDDDWERQTMIEQIDPVNGAANEFSAPAGIRIRGAGSRGGGHAKHSFKIIFRSKYGLGKLAFPLFGDEGADEFNRFDLRCSQNHSWANEDSVSETFVHEVFSRDSQRDMGEIYTRSRYYNLFINGAYWGLYQSQERGDEDFAASYNGGNADNYAEVKTTYEKGGYHTEVHGDQSGWEAMIAMDAQGFAGEHVDNYMKILGRNPDGTRNPAYPCYLNPTNLMVYMISSHYACDSDCPAAPSLPNNLHFLRDTVDGEADSDGYFFLRHDAEHSLGVRETNMAGDQATQWSQYTNDPTVYGTQEGAPYKPQNGNWNDGVGFNPAELHWQLCKNPIYRRAFGDQFYRHCLRPGGAMTVTNSLARFRSRMAEIDDVIVCEAARWSKDAANPKSREDWLAGCGFCIDFITNRMPHMVSQYRTRGWYPSVDTPEPDVWDGAVTAGQVVSFTCAEGGAVYVTTDGSDPAESGVVAAGGALTLTNVGACNVKARVLKDDEWSALQEVAYTVNVPDNDGYEFVLSGDYDTVKTIAPTGTTCKIVLTNANLNAGIVIPAGVTAKFNASTNTENFISYIDAPESEVRFTGDGTVRLEGQDTLAMVLNFVVKSGTLEIVSTGVTATKTPVVNVLGFAEQKGGVIDMDLDVVTDKQIYGIYIANKDTKDATTGKNLGLVYGLFDGGEFNARVGGRKSAAVYVNKGSVNCTFKGGETVNAELTGPEARFANVAGDLVFKRCTANVTMPEDCGGITDARVFKADKCISVSGGHYAVNTPGPGTEIFSAGDAIAVSGGTFELSTHDDCFSALNNITVSGGLIYAVSTANDVFDSNGDMEISGGTILAYATAEGHEAFDVEPELTEEGTTPHQLRINGGVIFATGGKTADWPDDLVATVDNLYAQEDLTAADYSGKYISFETAAGVVYTAQLPTFPQATCAVLVACPNRTADAPVLSATAPETGSQDFHEFYVNEKVEPEYPEVVETMVATNGAVKAWIDGLAADPTTKAAILSYGGDAEALMKCYLLNEPPTYPLAAEVELLSIAIVDGKLVVSGGLSIGGAEVSRTVNGDIRLYHATSLDELKTTKDYLDLGHAVPVTETPDNELGCGAARFFRLKVE